VVDIREHEDDWKVVVARLVSSGLTIQRVADFLGVSYFVVYFLVRRIESDIEAGKTVLRGRRRRKLELVLPSRQGRKLTRKKLKQVRWYLTNTNLRPTEIARELGIRSTYAIYKVRKELEARSMKNAGQFQPERKSHVCPKHGQVAFSPCVQCAAEAAREAKRLKNQPA
jgi:DNA-binding CsgD family transcriptional regulator